MTSMVSGDLDPVFVTQSVALAVLLVSVGVVVAPVLLGQVRVRGSGFNMFHLEHRHSRALGLAKALASSSTSSLRSLLMPDVLSACLKVGLS